MILLAVIVSVLFKKKKTAHRPLQEPFMYFERPEFVCCFFFKLSGFKLYFFFLSKCNFCCSTSYSKTKTKFEESLSQIHTRPFESVMDFKGVSQAKNKKVWGSPGNFFQTLKLSMHPGWLGNCGWVCAPPPEPYQGTCPFHKGSSLISTCLSSGRCPVLSGEHQKCKRYIYKWAKPRYHGYLYINMCFKINNIHGIYSITVIIDANF